MLFPQPVREGRDLLVGDPADPVGHSKVTDKMR